MLNKVSLNKNIGTPSFGINQMMKMLGPEPWAHNPAFPAEAMYLLIQC